MQQEPCKIVLQVNYMQASCKILQETCTIMQGLSVWVNYKLIIGCQCRQEMGKIPNFTDSERFKTPKTDFLLKFYKDSFISLDSKFVDLQNTEERATLMLSAIRHFAKIALFIETTPHPGSSTEHAYHIVSFPDHIFRARRDHSP